MLEPGIALVVVTPLIDAVARSTSMRAGGACAGGRRRRGRRAGAGVGVARRRVPRRGRDGGCTRDVGPGLQGRRADEGAVAVLPRARGRSTGRVARAGPPRALRGGRRFGPTRRRRFGGRWWRIGWAGRQPRPPVPAGDRSAISPRTDRDGTARPRPCGATLRRRAAGPARRPHQSWCWATSAGRRRDVGRRRQLRWRRPGDTARSAARISRALAKLSSGGLLSARRQTASSAAAA